MNQNTLTQTGTDYAALRSNTAAGTQAVAAAIAMGPARMLGLGLQSSKSPNQVILALVAPFTVERFNKEGHSLTILEAAKDSNNYSAVDSIEARAGAEIVVATTDFQQLLEQLEKAGNPFEQKVLAQVAKAIQATGRKSDLYLTNRREDLNSWLKGTTGQKLERVLLMDNTPASVARLSSDGLFVATFIEDAFLVTERNNATKGEGHNWARKEFPLGTLLHITPIAPDGYLTATYENEEGVRQAIRIPPFTSDDNLQVAGQPFSTNNGIVVRDDPDEAFVIQYDAEAANEVARAYMYAAKYDNRRNQQAGGKATDQVYNPGTGGTGK